MTTNDVGLFAALAVLLFWIVGAYNRLVGLRNSIALAWAAVDEQLRRRHDALPPLVAALREHLHDEQHALDAVLAARQQVQAASDTLRARPVDIPAAGSMATAEGVLAAAIGRLLALLERHPDLSQAAAIDRWMSELHDADRRLAFARQQFNERVQTYNEAARQFPTNIVARLFGLGLGGRF